MLKSFSARPYQKAIFEEAAKQNTLVVLPTGLGKTAIAMMLAAKRIVQYPSSKILFLAPTKPLVEQQLASFQEQFLLDKEEFILFTGAVAPSKRHELWQRARFIFSTPQTIENDVLSRKIDLSDVSLLIIDEAHRATGDYAYVFLAQEYVRQAKYERILALTASPGTDKASIQEVMDNLHVQGISYRKSDDPDVASYTQETNVVWEQVLLSPRHQQIVSYLEEAYALRLQQIREYGFTKEKTLSKTQLLLLQQQLHKKITPQPDSALLHSISLCAQALKLSHAIELVQTQTLHAAYQYMQGILAQARTTKTKSIQQLAIDPQFLSALAVLRELKNQGKEHPKVDLLIHHIHKTHSVAKTKTIIFTQFRDTAVFLQEKLQSLVSVAIFFGQAKKNGHGLTQKEQKRILDDFRAGAYDCLIATSVAEEGLDIPAVDTVFFFEPIPSAIRSVQRRGRTGRHSAGKVVVLVAKNTRDDVNRWVSFHKEKRMYDVLAGFKMKGSLDVEQKQQKPLAAFVQEQQPKVIADFREKGSNVLKALNAQGVNLELKQLGVGDFLLSKDVCVEYKKYDDFAASVIDNRLLIQLRSLTQYTKPLVIIEGDLDEHNRQLNRGALYGMLSAIAISYRIPIIQTKNPTQTAQLLITIARREQEQSSDAFTYHAAKPLDDKTLLEYIVGSLPGIGGALAKQLLEKFDSVEGLMRASVQDLMQVPLIGEKKAKEIRRVLSLSYSRVKKQ